jgi:hypothetical protein
MPRETVGLKIDIDSRSVATAARRSDNLARSSGRVGTALGGMARAAAAVGVAATAAVAGVVALTLKVAEQADEIAKHSTRIGVSIESYQELTHAMELSGGSIGEASAAIRRLSGNMLDASQGVSTAVDAFAGLGIETTTAVGGLRSVDDVLADIADEFAGMEDGAEKTARAMELFGRSGATLIPLLNQGSEGIAEMRQEAHDLGLVISDETAAAAEAFNDDLTRLRGVATGFARDIATELIPRMRILVGRFEDMIRGADDLENSIASLAGDALDGFVATLQTVASLTIDVTQAFLWWKMAYEAISMSANDSGQRVDQFGNSIRNSAQETNHQIQALDDLQARINSLDFSNMMVEGGAMRGAEAVVASVQALTDSMMGVADVDLDLDPGGSVGIAAEELDKFELAAKNASAAVVALNAASEEAARGIAESMAAAADEMQALFDTKAADHAAAEHLKRMEAFANATKDTGKAIEKEVLDASERFETLGKLGNTAFNGLIKGFQGLGAAAFWKKDGDALKSFGLAMGEMLVQLGTMAVAYAAVAALGAFFPALVPLVGKPAAAPVLAVAGLGAIAAGATLGAAIPRGSRGGDTGGGGGQGQPVETSRTAIYNVTLGAGMPARGMNRALLEQVGSAVGQGV